MTPALRKIPAGSLQVSKPTWWLESRFHFSFADYFDPQRQNFGCLRVLNDDLVQPHAGFGAHPHRDAEIFSYIVEGSLSHQDSMQNKESLPRGCVQYLSAGTGIRHSEMNDGDETTRFLQVWLTPDKRGHKPQYGSSVYTKQDRHNQLLHLLGGNGSVPQWKRLNPGNGTVRLHQFVTAVPSFQDANVIVSENDAGAEHSIDLGPGRQAYMVCIEGSLDVNDVQLSQRDAVELVASKSEPLSLTLRSGGGGSHFMLIEMQQP
eukprot:jgi/Astpho2/5623/fgenesh1_pm.00079_%23_32_t